MLLSLLMDLNIILSKDVCVCVCVCVWAGVIYIVSKSLKCTQELSLLHYLKHDLFGGISNSQFTSVLQYLVTYYH